MNLSDYLNAINNTKQNIIKQEGSDRDYVPFIVNKCLSYYPDTILIANEINQKSTVSKEMHFSYLLNMVRKGKRFSKWNKQDQSKIDDLNTLKEYYGFSYRKAEEALSLLSVDQLNEIKERINKGGKFK